MYLCENSPVSLSAVPWTISAADLPNNSLTAERVPSNTAGALRTVAVFYEFFVLFCDLRCLSVLVSGSLSKCAGLTRSRGTVSTLPLIRIFMTLQLLTMTLYGPS